MHHRVKPAAAAAILLLLLPVTCGAWEQLTQWSTVGEVSAWKELDGRFYRLSSDRLFLDHSQEKVDQQAAYARTAVYDGSLGAITLEKWSLMDAEARAERARLADRQLDFVVTFRQRIETQAQRARQSEPTGWGVQIADITVVGDCLQRLRTAVGLDPSNPCAWHLYGWLASCVGDRSRAASALAGAQQALALVPEGQLLSMRREVTLDQAWLAWERGESRAAAKLVGRAAALGADEFEVALLKGLLAARRGDRKTAFAEADKLRHVAIRRFPINYRTSGAAPEINNIDVWTVVPSDYAESWIRALYWIKTGQLDLAGKVFRDYDPEDFYPQAHRFWDDAGMIYEVTGRRDMALRAWEQARITTPFAPYFPCKSLGGDLAGLTGRAGALPVYLGFDSFVVAGNRLALAVALVDAMGRTRDQARQKGLAADALAALELCVARGHYPVEAARFKDVVRDRLAVLSGH